MDMKEEFDLMTQKYLEGQLTASEHQRFESMLAQSPELAAEVQDLKQLHVGLQALGVEKLASELQEWEQEQPSQGIKWRPLLTAAAVITLLLVPAWYFLNAQKPTSEDLFLAYYQPYEEMITQRGMEGDPVNPLLRDGLTAYNSGAYKRTAELLGAYIKSNPDDHRVALYLAIAQLEIDQKELAAANFKRAQQDPDVKDQALWYQALTYLKFSEKESAMEILTEIADNNKHYRQQDARKLLKKLD